MLHQHSIRLTARQDGTGIQNQLQTVSAPVLAGLDTYSSVNHGVRKLPGHKKKGAEGGGVEYWNDWIKAKTSLFG